MYLHCRGIINDRRMIFYRYLCIIKRYTVIQSGLWLYFSLQMIIFVLDWLKINLYINFNLYQTIRTKSKKIMYLVCRMILIMIVRINQEQTTKTQVKQKTIIGNWRKWIWIRTGNVCRKNWDQSERRFFCKMNIRIYCYTQYKNLLFEKEIYFFYLIIRKHIMLFL